MHTIATSVTPKPINVMVTHGERHVPGSLWHILCVSNAKRRAGWNLPQRYTMCYPLLTAAPTMHTTSWRCARVVTARLRWVRQIKKDKVAERNARNLEPRSYLCSAAYTVSYFVKRYKQYWFMLIPSRLACSDNCRCKDFGSRNLN